MSYPSSIASSTVASWSSRSHIDAHIAASSRDRRPGIDDLIFQIEAHIADADRESDRGSTASFGTLLVDVAEDGAVSAKYRDRSSEPEPLATKPKRKRTGESTSLSESTHPCAFSPLSLSRTHPGPEANSLYVLEQPDAYGPSLLCDDERTDVYTRFSVDACGRGVYERISAWEFAYGSRRYQHTYPMSRWGYVEGGTEGEDEAPSETCTQGRFAGCGASSWSVSTGRGTDGRGMNAASSVYSRSASGRTYPVAASTAGEYDEHEAWRPHPVSLDGKADAQTQAEAEARRQEKRARKRRATHRPACMLKPTAQSPSPRPQPPPRKHTQKKEEKDHKCTKSYCLSRLVRKVVALALAPWKGKGK